MRTGILRGAAGATALAALLALTGCVEGERLPTLPPTPTATPLFASEEEAIAAAKEAYAAYLEMSNLISSEGGIDPERIAPFVTHERLDDELRGFQVAVDHNIHLEGRSEFEVLEIQQVDLGPEARVIFYVCWDGSDTRVIDGDGVDVTPPGRIDRMILEVHVRAVDGELPLVLESDQPWSNDSC